MEHQISTWAKTDGTWDVTLHSCRSIGDGYLHDMPDKFQNLKTRAEAEKYAYKLFKRRLKPNNNVSLSSPDSFGQEVGTGKGWGKFDGKSWLVRFDKGQLFFWSSPANPNDKSNVPKFVLDALNESQKSGSDKQ